MPLQIFRFRCFSRKKGLPARPPSGVLPGNTFPSTADVRPSKESGIRSLARVSTARAARSAPGAAQSRSRCRRRTRTSCSSATPSCNCALLTHRRARLTERRNDARKAKAKAEDASNGNPIQLRSKPLAIRVVGDEAFVAENGFVARRLDLVVRAPPLHTHRADADQTGESRGVYRGHAGPVTSLALHKGRLFTGSWDKTVKVWDIEVRSLQTSRRALTRPQSQTLVATLEAHSDFVNCVHVVPELDVLLTGSSDRDVRIWPLDELGASRPALRSHTRPVQVLASHVEPTGGRALALSADSMGCLKAWLVSDAKLLWTCKPHETGIYDVQVGVADETAQIWTASADRSVLLSAFAGTAPPTPLLRIVHPYYVRSLTYLPLASRSDRPWLFTGGTDEEIRLFDLSAFDLEDAKKERVVTVGARSEGIQPLATLSGHWHEVGGLAAWTSSPPVKVGPEEEAGSEWLVSIGLDGTVRRWNLAQIGRPRRRPKPVGLKLSAEECGPPLLARVVALTMNREAELADLLDDM